MTKTSPLAAALGDSHPLEPSGPDGGPSKGSRAKERERVLVVDDDARLRESLFTLLGRFHDVHLAPNGQAGLELLQQNDDFAVILSDLKMPRMPGVEFLERARSLAPRARRLVLSGHGDFEAALAATNRGQISRFLTKPAPSELVLNAVQQAISDYRAEANARDELRGSLAGAASSDRLALLGTMVGTIAHEMKNWTAAVRGLVDGFPRDAAGNVQLGQDDLDDLNRVILHLEGQSQGILNLARPSTAARAHADLTKLVSDAVDLLKSTGALRRMTLEADYTDAPLQVLASPSQVEQVILNLCKNAVDAMEDAPRKHLRVSTLREQGFAVCRVADTGCGMPPEHAASAFEPFFTTKGVGKGTGLGLHVAKSILGEHGGTIDIVESSSAGTVMQLRVPLDSGGDAGIASKGQAKAQVGAAAERNP